MNRIGWVLAIAGLVLLLAAAGSPAEQYRAYWADAFADNFKTTGQVDQLVTDILASNCNMVVTQLRRRGDTYYPSPLEGGVLEDGSYDPNFDALAYLIKKCHSSTPRVEVHAWLCTLPIWKGSTPPSATTRAEHPYNVYPQFLSKTSTGTTFDGSNFVFDPGNPDCLKYEADVYMDVANRYDLDGIHYDYIRYAAATYGYNQASQDRFNARFGYYPTSDTDATWTQWRRDQITAMARQVYGRALAAKAIRQAWGLRPNVSVSGSTITWGNGPGTNEAGWTSTSAYASVLQDWRAWMEEGILDLNSPMTYYNYATYPTYYQNWIEYEKNHRYNRHLMIGPGTYLNTVPNCYTEINLGLQPSTLGNYADGMNFYSFNYPSGPEPTPADPVRFRAMLTTPNADNNNNPPYPTKVGIPVQTWKENPVNGHVMGVVTQLSAGKSIPFDCAKVTLVETGKSFETDGTGYFLFVDLPASPAGTTYTVRAEKRDGSLTQNKTVTITRGNLSTVNFNLGAADAAAPVISSVHVAVQPSMTSSNAIITDSQAVIAWNTDEPADSRIEYGITTSYGSLTPLDPMLSGSRSGYLGAALGHTQAIRGLRPSTLYHYRVISRDSSGNQSVSGDYTFTTAGTDLTAPAILNPTVTGVDYDRATISWTTDEPANSQIEYGADFLFGSATTLDANLVTSHAMTLTGLLPGTTYHFRIKSADAAANQAVSYEMVFTTSENTNPPAISNVQVINTTMNSAIITWNTDKLADSQVFFGLSAGPPYAYQTSVEPSMTLTHSVQLTGLTPASLYHYQVRSADAGARSTVSADQSFSTLESDTTPPVFSGLAGAVDSYLDAASIKLSWTAATDATLPITYSVYMATTPGGENFSAPVATTTGTSYIVSGLTTGQTYYFVVRARDGVTPPNSDANTVELSAAASNLAVESRTGGINFSAYMENSGPWANSTAKSLAAGLSPQTLGSRFAAPLYTTGTVNRATFQPNIVTAGLYNVYTTWGDYGPNCKHAKYSLTYDGGGGLVSYLDQIGTGTGINKDTWLQIGAGPVPFKAGTGGKLVTDDSENQGAIHAGNTGRFYADSIRMQYVGPAFAAPATLGATAGTTIVSMSWSAVPGASSYNIYRSTATGSFGTPLTNVTATSYIDNAVVSGTTYYYVIRAVDGSGNAGFASPQAQATPDSTPPTFSGVAATGITTISATINWTTNEPADTQLEYGTTTSYGTTTTLNTSKVTSHSVPISGLTASTLYHYRVRSADAMGNQGVSGDYTFTTNAPSLPTFLIESRSGGLNYSWYTAVPDIGLSNNTGKSTATGVTAGIGSRRQTTNTKTGVATFTPALSATAFPGNGYYRFYATWSSSSSNRCANTRVTVNYDPTWGGTGSDVTYVTQDGAVNGNTWVAVGNLLPLSGSNDKIVLDDQVNTTNSSSYYFRSDAVKFEYYAPLPPTGVSITNVGRHSMTLNWTNAGFDCGSVRIYRSTAAGTLGTLVATVSGTTWSDSGLNPLTTYHYTLRTLSAGQTLSESPNVNQISAVTQLPLPTFGSAQDRLDVGWNLFSLPATPEDPDPLTVLSGIDVANSSLQYWENDVDGGGYQLYGPTFGWTGPMQVGIPYWLLLTDGPKAITYHGTESLTDWPIHIPAHQTAPYWGMLGQPFNHNTYCADIKFSSTSNPTPLGWVDAYNAGIVESSAQCFKNAGFVSVGPAGYMVEQDRFEAWYGYWLLVRTQDAVTVTVPVSPIAP